MMNTDSGWHLPDPERQPEFYADVPVKRLIAWVIDTLLTVLACLAILPFTAFVGIFFFPVLMLSVGLAYRIVTIARGSATWGMRLVAIEFRDRAGRRFDLSLATLHSLGFTFSVAVPIFQLVSIVLMLTTPRGQGLSDHVLGTVAVNRRAGA